MNKRVIIAALAIALSARVAEAQQPVTTATTSPEVLGIGATTDTGCTANSTGSLNCKIKLLTSQLDSVKTAVEALAAIIAAARLNVNIGAIGGVAASQDTQFQHDTALGTITSATGGGIFCRASAAAPTDVSADNDAAVVWCLKNGEIVVTPAYAGVLASTGVGVAGTGTPRVVDVASGTTGSGVPTQAGYIGAQDASANLAGDIVCTSSKIYDASTSGNTELVAISGSKNIYICGYEIIAGGTVNVSLVAGTGTACASAASGTPSTGTSGAAAALTPAWQLTAQSGKISAWPTHGYMIASGTANALCIKTSAGQAVQAQVFYQQR